MLQRAVVELARVHGLSGVEISAILRRDVAEIRLMAIDGLEAFAAPMDADDF